MVNRNRKVCSFTLSDKAITQLNELCKSSFVLGNSTKSQVIEALIYRTMVDKEKAFVTTLKELNNDKSLIDERITSVSKDFEEFLQKQKRQEADVRELGLI